MSFYDAIRVGASGAGDYEVERSLRFNIADNAVLTRSPSSTTNSTKQTLSFWFKISGLINADNQGVMFAGGSDGSYAYVQNYQNTFYFGNSAGPYWKGNLTLRDFSAWYHAVMVIDTTLSTANDRQKLYINGVQQERNSGSSNPSQNSNYEFFTNSSWTYRIGKRAANDMNFDGYMTEINFIQGLALDASYFGETDALTGQWNPKKYVGSYGTNGFYLNFSDNSGTTATTLGKDSSGNSNNWTPSNFSVSAGAGNDSVTDTPTNNFATLNGLNFNGNSPSNGSLQSGTAGTSGWRHTYATFAMPSSGKWYWEVTRQGGAINSTNGICYGLADSAQVGLTRDINSNSNNLYLRQSDAQYNNGTYTTPFPTTSVGNVIQFAFDADTGSMWTGVNNTWTGANPSTGSSASWTSIPSGMVPLVGSYGSNNYSSINFGQQGFSYTPPTGYKALNSANLPDPTILLPNKHFDTVLYTGNNSSQEISTLNFQPDWLWFKSRSSTSWHALFDSLRGRGLGLASNNVNSEYTSSASNDLVSFDDDGFTLGSNQNWGSVNGSGNSIVTWAWDAGETDGATYRVVVVSDSGNKYRFRNSANSATFAQSAVTLDLAEGGTYTFDQSDSSMSSHPMQLSTTANGTHGGGSAYSTGVTYELDGSTVSASAFISGFSSASSRKLIITVAASAPTLYYYCYYHSGMGGQANTNSTLGSSNFDGSTQSTVKANTTAGFSIVKYTGQQNATDTIGHGLGIKPQVVISKSRNSTYTYTRWYVHHHKLTTNYGLFLDDTTASYNGLGDYYVDSSFSSTVFAVGDDIYGPNVSNNNYIAYCFNEVEGYSKFGSYTPNQNDNGPFVYTGFRPAWILIKSVGNIFGGGSPFSGNWYILDTKRSTFNVASATMAPNQNYSEDTGWTPEGVMDILSNGFKIRTDSLAINATLSGSFIYLAFAELPFKNSRAR